MTHYAKCTKYVSVNEFKRQFADYLKGLHFREGEQRAGIGNDSLNHSGQNLIRF